MSKKLLCIMCCLFTTLTTFSQNKEESLSTPELFDFVLLKCDLSSPVESKDAIDGAFQERIKRYFHQQQRIGELCYKQRNGSCQQIYDVKMSNHTR